MRYFYDQMPKTAVPHSSLCLRTAVLDLATLADQPVADMQEFQFTLVSDWQP